MSNQSIVEHKANMFYVEFREDYLLICLNCTYKKSVKGKEKSKASPYCKALILAISESWTNEKRGKGTDLSFYMTYPQWIESMYGMFGRNVVIDSVDELIGEGLLSREPIRYKGKDTFRYTLNHAEINQRMKALPDRTPYTTSPQVNGLISKRDEKSTDLQVNGLPFTNQRDTSLQVNEDAFTKGRNIESTNHLYVDSPQNPDGTCSTAETSSPSGADAPTPTPSLSSQTDLSTSTVEKPRSKVEKRASRAASQDKPKPLVTEFTEGGRKVHDSWGSLFKSPPVAGPKTIECANALYPRLMPWCQELRISCRDLLDDMRKWEYATDPDYYRPRGVTLCDLGRDFERWQSAKTEELAQASAPKPTKSGRRSLDDDPISGRKQVNQPAHA